MVDRDSHGRTMAGRAIPKRGPPNTIGTGITDSMESPHRSPRTKPKGDRKHHPIMVSLSHIRSWCLSLTQANHTGSNHSACSTCLVRHMAICNTCHHPRCGYTHCNASKTSCPTCHETNIPTPVTPGTDMLSANLHHKGLHFVEHITGMGSNPKSIEMDLEEIDPQTDPNIRFRVVVQGWSNKNQQA